MLDLFIVVLVAITVFVWWQATKPRQAKDSPKRKAHPKETGVCIRVVDGDTMQVAINGTVAVVRLLGVNAPEHGQTGFHAATETLRKLAEGKTVALERDRTDKDKYNRLLRYVWVGEKFINRELVRSGKAKVMAIAPNTSRIAEMVR